MSYQVCKGTFKMGTATANTDVSDQISQAALRIMRSAVTVPETGSEDEYNIGGSLTKEVIVSYISASNSGASASPCSVLLWDAILANTTLKMSAVLYPGVVSSSNPRYLFTMSPFETQRGGVQGELATGDATYSIVGDITVETI